MEKGTHSYLETEGRIVAEDAKKAAIVVRIPKAMLAHNMPFVAALADRLPKYPTIVPA